MYTGFHETSLDKIALCAESIRTAKINITEEDGIGSDLNINIFGWKNNELITVTQLKNTFSIPKDERIKLVIETSAILRRGWGITEFTLAAEGFCSMHPSKTQGNNLGQLFAQKDSPVSECISFMHLENDSHTFVALPYKVKIGRKIDFGQILWFDGGKIVRDIEYPAALKACLKLDVEQYDDNFSKSTYFGTLASAIMDCGFEIFYRDDI